ncbi:hypothetical protein GQE99_14505 [Maritimibacter sp. DP07]|uniref:50S ribosomal protein L9 n=1 Tax=Maritimibacter harenae TaxID=2606218 RepID=A0A845MB29_9RHOB|nr:hypothetical protein [Maritimibacter harenae]MZR14231.1 hypothetical protein [Maritimibacter harenae]
MKVKLLIARASADGAQNRGEVVDVPDATAKRMIEAQQAVPVRGEPREKAVPKKKAEKRSAAAAKKAD